MPEAWSSTARATRCSPRSAPRGQASMPRSRCNEAWRGRRGRTAPLSANAAWPLDELRGEAGFEERIKRAELTLEQRIQDLVASKIEKAFGSLPEEGGGKN